MPETSVETALCGNCGVERREGTTFCYNCGEELETNSTAEALAGASETTPQNGHAPDRSEGQAALDALAAKLSADEAPTENDDKLVRAAEERKKARVKKRTPRSFTWEPETDSRAVIMLLVAIAATLITAVIVIMSLSWK